MGARSARRTTCRNYMVVGRLKPGVTLAQARQELGLVTKSPRAQYGEDEQAIGADIEPLQDYIVQGYRALVAVVFGAPGLVLLIACTNLLSAQLARGWSREREIDMGRSSR